MICDGLQQRAHASHVSLNMGVEFFQLDFARINALARRTASPSFLKLIADATVRAAARIVNAATAKSPATTRAAALALGLFVTPPLSNAIDAITGAVTSFVQADIGAFQLHFPRLGAAGRAHDLTGGRAQCV